MHVIPRHDNEPYAGNGILHWQKSPKTQDLKVTSPRVLVHSRRHSIQFPRHEKTHPRLSGKCVLVFIRKLIISSRKHGHYLWMLCRCYPGAMQGRLGRYLAAKSWAVTQFSWPFRNKGGGNRKRYGHN